MQRSRGEGMVTMDQYLKALLDGGYVAWEDAVVHASNPMSLR